MSDKEKVMKRLSEHLEAVKGKHPEWVGIFLQGSQNYNLDYEGSDVDSKLIVLPSFEDFVLNKSPYSYTHIMENDEHVDVKDMVMNLMQTAETKFETGAERKEWVLAMVKASADTIDYDIDMDAISDLIDSLCNMSKVVNAPKA